MLVVPLGAYRSNPIDGMYLERECIPYLALEFARLEGGDEVLDVEEVVPAERALHVVDHALRAGAQDVAELVLRRRRRRHRRPGKNLSINDVKLENKADLFLVHVLIYPHQK